jgi:hypothetical protein
MKKLYRSDSLFFVINVSFWTLLSLFTFLKAGGFRYLAGEVVYWAHIFSYTFTSGILWIVFSFLIQELIKYFKERKISTSRIILFHLLLAPIISAIQRISSMSLDYFIQTKFKLVSSFPSYSEYLGGHFARRWVEGLLWYALIAAAIYGYLQFRKNKEEITNLTSRFIPIKKKGMTMRIPLEDVLFIKSESNYCYIHTKEDVFKMRSSIKSLEQSLIDSSIKRIHNSFLVNSDKVLGYQHVQNGEYVFSIQNCDKRIFSTRTYRNEAKNIIDLIQK